MNTEIFTVDKSLGPRRKKRGKRRYYRELRNTAENFSIIQEPDHWFYCWHHHVASSPICNVSWEHRHEHIKALFKIFHRVVAETELLKIPFQIWLIIHEKQGYDDSIYLHTHNPHSEFPCVLKNIEWGKTNIEKHFKEFFAPHSIRAGVSYDDDLKQNVYYLYSPSLGESLE